MSESVKADFQAGMSPYQISVKHNLDISEVYVLLKS